MHSQTARHWHQIERAMGAGSNALSDDITGARHTDQHDGGSKTASDHREILTRLGRAGTCLRQSRALHGPCRASRLRRTAISIPSSAGRDRDRSSVHGQTRRTGNGDGRVDGRGPCRSYRLCLYIMSTSSSYISAASAPPDRIADAAQCLRWLRISSRPTARNASCVEDICVMMSAQ